MHLLRSVTPSRQNDQAIDLGQSPADLVILSAADSDLLPIQAAYQALVNARPNSPTLRLAHLLTLSHPASIDLYAETVLSHAKLVVVRLLGGDRYWSYGVKLLRRLADENRVKLAFIAGEPNMEDSLTAQSTLPAAILQRIHAYFVAGGRENAENLLGLLATLVENPSKTLDLSSFAPSHTTPPFGIYQNADIARNPLPPTAPVIKILFYRALLVAGDMAAIDALVRSLSKRGAMAQPIFVPSLKDAEALAYLRHNCAESPPDLIITLTNFAAASVTASNPSEPVNFAAQNCPILQAILSSDSHADWQNNTRGLNPRDLAMAVMLPELDGRLAGGVISFKQMGSLDPLTQFATAHHQPVPELIDHLADLALAWVTLRRRPPANKKIALVLGNYPVRDGRMANGVGLDTPQAVVDILAEMGRGGYQIGTSPGSAAALMTSLQNGATNDLTRRRQNQSEILGDPTTIFYDLRDYQRAFAELSPQLQESLRAKWGDAENDPYLLQKPDGSLYFPIAALVFQNIVVMLQPPRGYALDEEQQNYHDPALIPPHYYWACYFWLRHQFGVQAIIHIGKHGTLEWLPGKSVALSPDCLPHAMLGAIPVIYPFIVNDPGEGSQAKRRTAAVIIDHLTPPLTQAGSYGEAAQLEALIDEYYQAAQFATNFDIKRQKFLQAAIAELADKSGIAAEAGLKMIPSMQNDSGYLPQLDAYLCDLKEWQIRDGLHIFGQTPAGAAEIALLLALARIPRGMGRGKDASLMRALAADFDLRATPESEIFDPLTADRSIAWTGAKPTQLQAVSDTVWRHSGDTIERLELFAAQSLSARATALDPKKFPAAHPVLDWMVDELTPHLRQSGQAEMAALMAALAGKFVAPGPSGAPSRGRPDCLPTGRNFYSLDARSMPTQAAWRVGWQSACLMLERHLQENGEDLQRLVLSCWGTAQMRTGGDDIAQALALMGVQPQWEPESGRVIGFDIMPVSALGRPRVDVTLRISGFFRDAFPNLIDLFDRASRAVATLPPELESAADNPLADSYRRRAAAWQKSGLDTTTAELMAGYRIFGAKTGSYGAGLQHIMDEEAWQSDAELSEIFLSWSRFAYGSDGQGGSLAGEDRLAPEIAAAAQSQALRELLAASQAVVQNQDNREHDLLDSDDYYQFEGGLAATIKHLSGTLPAIYHNDHSRPDHPVIRSLSEELSRVIRARVTNPRWLEGVRRHGYKGASEMAASLDYMAAFQALTHQIKDHQFDAVYQAFLGDAENLAFLRAHNPAALQEIAAKFQSLIDRGLWQSQRNAIYEELKGLVQPRAERSDELTKTPEKLRPA